MTNNEILQADLLDLLFNNRNKQYGAYVLRKTYPQRLWFSFGLTAFMAIGACLLISGQSAGDVSGISEPPCGVQLTDVYLPPPVAPEAPSKPAEPKAASKPVAQRHFTNQIAIVPDLSLKETDFPPQAELEVAAIGPNNVEGAMPETNFQPVQAMEGKNSGVVLPEEPAIYEFASVEEMAEFPGGMGAFQRYLGRHLAGADNLEAGASKTVKVRFVIGKDGALSDILLLQSGGADLDSRVLKVLNKAPRWKPARQNGRDVAVVYTLPVTFVGSGE